MQHSRRIKTEVIPAHRKFKEKGARNVETTKKEMIPWRSNPRKKLNCKKYSHEIGKSSLGKDRKAWADVYKLELKKHRKERGGKGRRERKSKRDKEWEKTGGGGRDEEKEESKKERRKQGSDAEQKERKKRKEEEKGTCTMTVSVEYSEEWCSTCGRRQQLLYANSERAWIVESDEQTHTDVCMLIHTDVSNREALQHSFHPIYQTLNMDTKATNSKW